MKIETADQLSHACSIVGTELFERYLIAIIYNYKFYTNC